jgi:hypothetical protein
MLAVCLGFASCLLATPGCGAEQASAANNEDSGPKGVSRDEIRPFVGRWVLESPTGRGTAITLTVGADGFGTYEVRSSTNSASVSDAVVIVPRSEDRFTVHRRVGDGRSFGAMMAFKRVSNFSLEWTDPDRNIGDVKGRFLKR